MPAPFLKAEYRWTHSDFALLIIAFRSANAVMQTVAGRLLDWMGTRPGLLLTVSWYSVAAMSTAAEQGLGSFGVLRFPPGAGKTGRLPRRRRTHPVPRGFHCLAGGGPGASSSAAR